MYINSLTSLYFENYMFEGIFPQVIASDLLAGTDVPIDIDLAPQSGMQDNVKSMVSVSDVSNVALQFAEGLPGTNTMVESSKDDTFDMLHNSDMDMGDFLARPIRIANVEWNVGSSIPVTTYDLLPLFLLNKRVANRINNYAYINGTVNVRLVVSGTPQHHAIAIASLNPYWSIDSNLSGNGAMSSVTFNQLVQLPHLFIDPSTSTAGELSMPIITPFNAINMMYTNGLDGVMGLQLASLTPLDTVSTDLSSVWISIWVWMTDVVLSNPTADSIPGLSAQSGDEYGKKPVSKAATTISKVASMMTDIPVIAPYARATEMVSNNVASLAELFGYSRPNALLVEGPIQNKNIGNLTSSNFEDTSTKLTLDSKAEVTIDPTVLGLNLKDEMAFVNVATREGYLGNMRWARSNTQGTIIGRFGVNPGLARMITNTGDPPIVNDILDLTPACFCALPFRKWRGSMRFRFVVSSSHFHKGRLRIVVDPQSPMGILAGNTAWASEYNTTQSYILDLAATKELTITVPWNSNKSYLNVSLPGFGDTFDLTNPNSLGLAADSNTYNGFLGVHVMQPLVSPKELTTVQIAVFVSMCEDVEFAEPSGSFANYTFNGWMAQSGQELGADVLTGNALITTEAGSDDGADILGTKSKSANEKLALIHYGERIVSMRQLIKRYVTHQIYRVESSANTNFFRLSQNDFPCYKGFDPTAVFTDNLNNKYNYARDSFMAYFTLAFLGRRGGIRQKYILHSQNIQPGEMIVSRQPNLTGAGFGSTPITNTGNSALANSINNPFDVRSGAAAVYCPLNNCLEVETPYYSTNRFHFAKNMQKNQVKASSDDRFKENFHHLQLTYLGGTASRFGMITRYVAAADDFQLIFFKYAPLAVVRTSPPPNAVN